MIYPFRYLLSIFLLACSLSVMSQVNIDSNYRYSELNDLLSQAREENNKEDIAAVYYLLAEFDANNFDNFGNALSNYSSARKYYDLLDDSLMVAKIDRAIGNQYIKSGFYQEALESYEKALDYFTNINNINQVAYINYEISQVYNVKGDLELELKFLNKAIEMNNKLGDPLLHVEFMLHKIKTYERLNELDSAIITTLEAVKYSDSIDHRQSMSKSLYHLGYLNKIKSNYNKAIKYLKSAEKYDENRPYSEDRKLLYQEIAETYDRLGEFESAYKYSQKYAALNDSILNKNRIESVNNFALKYATVEQKSNIQILQSEKKLAEQRNRQQRNAMYILTAGLLLLLALLYYIINFYRQKLLADEIINGQKQEIAQQKIRELEDNIKISSMQSMLEGQEIERERISKDLHDSLGGLLSTIKLQFDSVKAKVDTVNNLKEYRSANKMLDTAVEEVRSISQNLQPGSLMKLGLIPALKDMFNRFDEDIYPEIDFQVYDIPEKLPNMIALSIYRVIQELLHNTIKHAEANEVLIQINKENDELVIQFEDDGKGFDIDNLKRKGMGLENIRSRINYLKGQINFDSKLGEGTSVLIHVRYK